MEVIVGWPQIQSIGKTDSIDQRLGLASFLRATLNL